MVHPLYLALLPIAGIVFLGCGGSTETQEEQTTPPQTPAVVQTPQNMQFETRTDTVAMEQARRDSLKILRPQRLEVRYMVQIGAFKDPHYASLVQTAARERYHLPALNDYNTALRAKYEAARRP